MIHQKAAGAGAEASDLASFAGALAHQPTTQNVNVIARAGDFPARSNLPTHKRLLRTKRSQ